MSDTYVKNVYRVPKKVWTRWTLVGKHVFNKTMEFSTTSGSELMCNPKMTEEYHISDEYWKTIAWNHAWISADIASRGEKHLIDTLTKEIKGD